MNWRQWPWTKAPVQLEKRSHVFSRGCYLRIDAVELRFSEAVCSCGKVVVRSWPPLGFREIDNGLSCGTVEVRSPAPLKDDR